MSLADELLSGASGTIHDFAGINLPAGFLWAAGQAVSRSTYARLFAALTLSVAGTTSNGSTSVSSVGADLTAGTLGMSVVGWPISGTGIPAGTTIAAVTATTITLSQNATASGATTLTIAPHGVGDGVTTFNVPDCRGRVIAGRDDMGGTAASRLTTSGTGASDVNGARLGHAGGADRHQLTVAQMPAHNHTVNNASGTLTSGSYDQRSAGTATGAQVTTQNTGNDNAHPNVQPTFVCHKIIKT